MPNTNMANERRASDDVATIELGPLATGGTKHGSALSVAISDALLHSPLGRLPAEIRNTIYTFTLQQPHGLLYGESSWMPLHDGMTISQALSITATCKQIQAETKLMCFALNDVTILLQDARVRSLNPDLAVRSLNKIPLT
jgi:hypothetical protein